jgi:hypothetical protein
MLHSPFDVPTGVTVHYSSRLAAILLPERFIAITLGSHVFTRMPTLPPHVLRHEEVHVRQWRRYGYVRFSLRYLWYQMRYGYDRNPFEVEARQFEVADADANPTRTPPND